MPPGGGGWRGPCGAARGRCPRGGDRPAQSGGLPPLPLRDILAPVWFLTGPRSQAPPLPHQDRSGPAGLGPLGPARALSGPLRGAQRPSHAPRAAGSAPAPGARIAAAPRAHTRRARPPPPPNIPGPGLTFLVLAQWPSRPAAQHMPQHMPSETKRYTDTRSSTSPGSHTGDGNTHELALSSCSTARAALQHSTRHSTCRPAYSIVPSSPSHPPTQPLLLPPPSLSAHRRPPPSSSSAPAPSSAAATRASAAGAGPGLCGTRELAGARGRRGAGAESGRGHAAWAWAGAGGRTRAGALRGGGGGEGMGGGKAATRSWALGFKYGLGYNKRY